MREQVSIRTETPPEYIYRVRDMARSIAKVQQQTPTACYLHVKDWQRYRNLTNEDAAWRIGVAVGSYRNWADNRNWPSSFYLPQMASVFGCSIEELFFPPPGMRQ